MHKRPALNRQRGIADTTTLLIYAGIAIAVLLALWGLVHAWNSFVSGVEERGYERGQKATEALYAKRDNEALTKAQARVSELQAIVDGIHKEYAAKLAQVASDEFKRGRQYAENRARNAAAVAAGERLRDPGATACTARPGGSPAGAPGPAAGVSDGAAPGELSAALTGFLLDLADEADDVARQLASAQAVIVAQQKACGGP